MDNTAKTLELSTLDPTLTAAEAVMNGIVEDAIQANEIGSDEDFQDRAQERTTGDRLEAADREENTSIRRADMMREGFHAGFEAAAGDYVNGTATIQFFEQLREQRQVTDFYAIGFELGYCRKLSEILVG